MDRASSEAKIVSMDHSSGLPRKRLISGANHPARQPAAKARIIESAIIARSQIMDHSSGLKLISSVPDGPLGTLRQHTGRISSVSLSKFEAK
jgi:hypothetical protein